MLCLNQRWHIKNNFLVVSWNLKFTVLPSKRRKNISRLCRAYTHNQKHSKNSEIQENESLKLFVKQRNWFSNIPSFIFIRSFFIEWCCNCYSVQRKRRPISWMDKNCSQRICCDCFIHTIILNERNVFVSVFGLKCPVFFFSLFFRNP